MLKHKNVHRSFVQNCGFNSFKHCIKALHQVTLRKTLIVTFKSIQKWYLQLLRIHAKQDKHIFNFSISNFLMPSPFLIRDLLIHYILIYPFSFRNTMETKFCSFFVLSCCNSVLLRIHIYFEMTIFCTFFIWPRNKPTYLTSHEILRFIQISTFGRDIIIQIE